MPLLHDPAVRRSIESRLCVLLLVALAVPLNARAQVPSDFQALTLPPASAGTCAPVAARRAAGDTTAAHGSRLVLKREKPSRHREMQVVLDARGNPGMYSESGPASNDRPADGRDGVIATFDGTGGVHGYRIHTAVPNTDGKLTLSDTAAMRALVRRMQSQQTNTPLDAEAERQVRVLAAWLRKRCHGVI